MLAVYTHGADVPTDVASFPHQNVPQVHDSEAYILKSPQDIWFSEN
ncbi:hypothetical protein VINI7043_07310 [Vibrio nigripulchritudo ATCC 27043]|nr:hypothetical protein VINI7043_07310 [Vibrio nigripulchritudo ATCC 27043]